MFCRRSLRSEADMRAVLWRWTRDDGESLRVNWLRGCSNSARIMSLSCSSTKMRWTRLSLQRYITQNLRWCIKVSRFIVLFFSFLFCFFVVEFLSYNLFALNPFSTTVAECPAGCVGEKWRCVSHQRWTGNHQAKSRVPQLTAPAVPKRCKCSLWQNLKTFIVNARSAIYKI